MRSDLGCSGLKLWLPLRLNRGPVENRTYARPPDFFDTLWELAVRNGRNCRGITQGGGATLQALFG